MEILLTLTALALLYFFVRTVLLSKEVKDLKDIVLESYTKNYADDADKEGFIKFISDSREWAFDYIEDVQNALDKFSKTIEKDIAYFDKYGDVAAMKPNYDALVKISSAYKELKELLPKENNDKT